MVFNGKWRLLRFIILITFLAVCCFTVYIPHLTAVPPKQVRGWELNVTRDVTRYVNPSNDTTIISGREICEDPTFFVIIVTSAPANFVVRSAIRETWASHNISNVKVGFLVGVTGNSSIQNAIEEESLEFKDIIQDNFVDSYNNLTLKSVVLLKWFVNHCPSPVYLMKADDDSYVNVKQLTPRLLQTPQRGLLAGVLICKAKPISDAGNKWYSPKYMYHGAFYPNYLSGTGYVMSRDVVIKLYEASLSTPIHYLEDVYITGICAEKAGVRPQNFHGFNYLNMGLKCTPDVITNHRVTPSDLRALWSLRDNCTEVKTTAPPIKRKFSSGCH
uniref:Hexosyltransferase n=1 Tax=Lygus hesperus TaxID=30085 RepID=A0A0A9X3R4_LYGHE